jgi:hypothetical protein
LQLKTFSLLKQPAAVAVTLSLSNSSPQVHGNALLVLLALITLLLEAAVVAAKDMAAAVVVVASEPAQVFL